MGRAVGWWDRHQVPLFLAAMALGALVGALVGGLGAGGAGGTPASSGIPDRVGTPGAVSPVLSAAITPALVLLLFATFLAVPVTGLARAFRDARFLVSVLVLNFGVAPAVAFGLSRFVADDQALLVGVLLVLLTPCVDYVVVFTGLAGGDRARLLAATPLLMLAQLVLLPLYLLLFAGAETVSAIDPRPFAEAFVLLIVLPLGAAAIVQALARRHEAGRVLERLFAAAMVPLMMIVLFAVVGSQIASIGPEAATLVRLVPLYLGFLVVMTVAGAIVSRLSRLDASGGRALVFSGVTRNSLVVLPLALALPAGLGLAPLAVVTQTLVELVGLVVLVGLVPRILR